MRTFTKHLLTFPQLKVYKKYGYTHKPKLKETSKRINTAAQLKIYDPDFKQQEQNPMATELHLPSFSQETHTEFA